MSEPKHKVSDAQKRSSMKYQAAHTKRIAFDMNRNTRPRMLEYLDNIDNVNGYLKHLIAVDMKAKGIPTDGKDGE